MITSWKTTLFGVIGAVGAYLAQSQPPGSWLQAIGQILVVVGSVGVGAFARDNNVSSESAGAK